MPIDDYASATSLSKQLEASLPFTVRPGKPLLKRMKAARNADVSRARLHRRKSDVQRR